MNNDYSKIESKLIPINKLKQLKYFLYAGKFLFKRKQTRTKNQISKEYEGDIYQKLLENEVWENTNLETICFTRYTGGKIENNSSMSVFLYNDKFFQTNLIEIKRLYFSKIINKLKEFTSDSDIICELGCGFGKNLFQLKLDNFSNLLEGFDVSKNSIYVAKQINSKFDTKIKFDNFDMINDITSLDFSNKTLFTHLSLEQLKYDLEKIIKNLIKSNPSQVIHFEHVSEMYNFNLKHVASKIYYFNRDYQTNLLKILKNFQKHNLIEITHVEKFPYALNPFHEMGFIRWIPKNN